MTGNIGKWGESYTIFNLSSDSPNYKQVDNEVTISAVAVIAVLMKNAFVF